MVLIFLLLLFAESILLPVPSEGQGVSSFPVGSPRWSLLVGSVSLVSEATTGPSSGSESSELSVLHGGFGDPVHTRVSSDGLVGGIHEDDFVVLEGGVLPIVRQRRRSSFSWLIQ